MVYRRKHSAVAHWHFDEGNGTLAHDVDGGNTGTLGNGEAAKTPDLEPLDAVAGSCLMG